MTNQRSDRNSGRPVRHQGREYPVISRKRIAGRLYLLLEQLASPPRCRYRAFDPRVREFRTLLSIPADAVGRKHLTALRRASSSNDSLPKVIDSARDGDEHWLVLTWVNGVDLREYLKQVRAGKTARPSSREVIRLLRGLAHGLRHLHNNCSLIHGDLQTSNIILQSRPTRLVTIDFGNAWLRDISSMRDSGDGTSAVYAPPELQSSETLVDFRGDQFSASLIAYELLTLKIPYADLGGKAGRPGLIDRVGKRLDFPSKHSHDASRLPKSVRQGIDELLMRGLALHADDRFATPRAWVDAIDRVYHDINDLGNSPRTQDPLWRMGEWLGQHVFARFDHEDRS